MATGQATVDQYPAGSPAVYLEGMEEATTQLMSEDGVSPRLRSRSMSTVSQLSQQSAAALSTNSTSNTSSNLHQVHQYCFC